MASGQGATEWGWGDAQPLERKGDETYLGNKKI